MNHIRVIRNSPFYTNKFKNLHTSARFEKGQRVRNIIYLLGMILSAFSMKGFAVTHLSSKFEEPDNSKPAVTLNLRTPEYLKNEYN